MILELELLCTPLPSKPIPRAEEREEHRKEDAIQTLAMTVMSAESWLALLA